MRSGSIAKRGARPRVSRLTNASACDECQRLVGGIEPVEDIGHRDERREPGTPSVGAVGAPELDAGAHDLGGRHRRFEQTLHGLCDHEREPLLEAVAKALLEPLDAIARVARVDDHGVARDLHVEALRVVGPGVERASRHQIEARVMPVAGEQPGLDRALVQGEPEVRATIFDRERPSLVPEDHDGQRPDLAEQTSFALQIGERPSLGRRRDGVGHGSMLRPSREYVK